MWFVWYTNAWLTVLLRDILCSQRLVAKIEVIARHSEQSRLRNATWIGLKHFGLTQMVVDLRLTVLPSFPCATRRSSLVDGRATPNCIHGSIIWGTYAGGVPLDMTSWLKLPPWGRFLGSSCLRGGLPGTPLPSHIASWWWRHEKEANDR